jgi:hypothetical protein
MSPLKEWIMRSSIICTLHQMPLGQSYQGELCGWYLQHARGRRNAYNISVQKPEGRRPVWRLNVDGRIIIECSSVG